MAVRKVPLWSLLVDRGYFEDRKTATSWIMAGKVIINDRRADSAGEAVTSTASIRVKGLDMKYVGKGGLKLYGALSDFGMNITGQVALDTGASTGGFTDCLLQQGASKVYAIDAGYDQLAGKLRIDPRVVNMEKTNIADVLPDQLQPKPTIASVDLSYLSLKKAISIIVPLLDPQGELLCLVKPLFEITDSEIRRKGIIEDPALYRDILHELVDYVHSIGLTCIGVTHSHVTGNSGTREFFLRISQENIVKPFDIDTQIDNAIQSALKLSLYEKS